MAKYPLPSAGLRFVRTFGVAFFWALLIGGILGAAAYFRVERRDLDGDPRWHVLARLWLERLEWTTYDWRAREAGDRGEPADDVVLVVVDAETVDNARASTHPQWAMNPWPREVLATVAAQAIREGAAAVVLDEPVADVSPHSCGPSTTDDQRAARLLAAQAGKVVMGVEWQPEGRRPPDRPLNPWLVQVAAPGSDPAPGLELARVLLERTAPAYLFPDGSLWAGAATREAAEKLAAGLELDPPFTTRPLSPDDDDAEVTPAGLLVRLGRIPLPVTEEDRLPVALAVEAPVSPLLQRSIALAPATLVPDPDGVIRSVPLLVYSGGRDRGALPAVVSRTAMVVGHSTALSFEAGEVTIAGRFQVPTDDALFLMLRFDAAAPGRGGRGTMKRAISAWRLLVNAEDDAAQRGIRHHDNDLTGRVVVVVDERRSATQDLLTPVGPLSRGAILAQGITNVLRGEGVVRVPPRADFWLTLAFAIAGGALAVAWSSLFRRPGWLLWALTIAAVAGLHVVVARQLFIGQARWVAVAGPVLSFSLTFLASLGYARALEAGLRDFVSRALGGAVRSDVFRRVERDLRLMSPERRDLSVYFSDIEGFTAVAQQRAPDEVVAVLQSCLSELTTLVLDRQGHVDKYLGDGLMAFWGAPVELENPALLACHAALDMQARFEARRPDWEQRLGQGLVLRAGIDVGPTLVGEMGTSHRINYTVMGEPVATAFRLESLAKQYDARVLVGATVVERCRGTAEAPSPFLFREVDTLRLGRAATPVRVHELLGRKDELELPWLDGFEQAMHAWHEGRFLDAHQAFVAVREQRPQDQLITRYVERTAYYLSSPPPAPWDGVYRGP